MVFYMPERSGEADPLDTDHMSPKQIVSELDRHVVGQKKAKRAVAIALRNRVRRQLLPKEMAEEVAPKNIIMIGPTGVGKTEIARRLARMTSSPFIKVEASKFTEVGYVGRDVESMIRDLTDMAVELVKREKAAEVRRQAEQNTEERLLNLLLPPPSPATTPPKPAAGAAPASAAPEGSGADDSRASYLRSREKLRDKLRRGEMEDRPLEMEVTETGNMPSFKLWTNQGMEEMNINMKDALGGLFGRGPKKRSRLKVSEARDQILKEEEEKLIDQAQVARIAVDRVEQSGIVFLDEIDKVAGRQQGGQGPDVSREGVQRDLLPIVEGTLVNTKFGQVRTDHILFVASGAFHVAKPSDLIPELQGRFPIRVELDALGKKEFVRILSEPHASLTKQYTALMETEGVRLEFTADGLDAIADCAVTVNEATENIGARRLQTIMERLLEEILFQGSELEDRNPVIDRDFVNRMLADVVEDRNLSRYIL
ncbi:MAG: ATP-dependent protease ATPase subunit HslU [Planctomycetota bacterium]